MLVPAARAFFVSDRVRGRRVASACGPCQRTPSGRASVGGASVGGASLRTARKARDKPQRRRAQRRKKARRWPPALATALATAFARWWRPGSTQRAVPHVVEKRHGVGAWTNGLAARGVQRGKNGGAAQGKGSR
ncbi:hypothetical protein, conserved in T. vivax [Trypanosoma vivax Y486]|uniref:Uncharacterized protein n=1 Tax=Trypanosoma vivax (strain Y486) TaxID=1055687 RepID=F9WUH8_TRYVY|nr:hypothetical protein, conserved in T. vivax [Trypanosoma vivax Y486]|eukprot:CCD21227.1 hypothetical protein, conserved in T. vivax [Trypanosoma vivax Y486]